MSNFEEKSDTRQAALFGSELEHPGCLDVDTAVRAALAGLFKGGFSREAIAERMSHLVGREVTVAMLDTYTADSKRNHRFPAAWIPALCAATGDARLLQYLVQRTGYRMISQEEEQLLELGRMFLEQQVATRKLSDVTETLVAGRISR
jgi:hypothetical protein